MSWPASQEIIEATGADQVTDLVAGNAAALTVACAVRAHVVELTGMSDRTRADYLRDFTRHIEPTLGPLPVARLDRAAVAGWLNRLAGSDLADKTIANLHGLLSAVMASAAERGWREGNPCKGMRPPRRAHGDEEEMVCLTREEWGRCCSARSPTTGARWYVTPAPAPASGGPRSWACSSAT